MSFVSVAVGIGFTGVGATIAAGAMMGGATTVAGNVIGGRDPFDNIGRGVVLGGITGGIAPSVASTFDLSMPMAAGITQGGLTALATGDIGQGLMAGMGAYGAYGLAEGLGGGVSGSNIGAEQAFGDVQAVEGSVGDKFNKYLTGPDAGTKAFTDPRIGTGNFFKDNFKYMAAAAAPILAGESVQAKGPQTITKPGMIRPYSYDPYGGTYTAGTPYEAQVKQAAGGGLMGLAAGGMASYGDGDDVFRRTNDGMAQGGMYDFAQRSEPVVRMAKGGVAHFVIGGEVKDEIDRAYAAGDYSRVNELAQENKITAADVASTYQGFDTSGLAGLGINLYTPDTGGGGGGGGGGAPVDYFANQFAPDVFAPVVTGGGAPVITAPVTDTSGGLAALNTTATNTAATNTAATNTPQYTQYSDQQISDWFLKNKDATDAQVKQAIIDSKIDPAAVNRYIASLTSPFVGSTETKGGSGTLGIYNRMIAEGFTPKEAYDALIANDPKYAGWSLADITRGYNLDKGAYALSAAEKDGVSDKEWVNFMDTNKYSIDDMAQAFGLSIKEVRDRYNAVKAAEKKVVTTVTGGTGNDVITDTGGTKIIPGINDYGLGGTGTSGRLESVYGPALPPGVSGAGITTVNPNGTITTRPNIPGIPEGGFTGMTSLRDAYTKGGGSLGYTSPTYTKAQFKELYEDKLTGGSKQSYDYLTGKTLYDPTPYTKTGEIMKPYFESVGRFPENRKAKKYVFVNGKYELNPDYVKPSYVLAGEKAAADKAAAEEKAKTVEKDVATTVTGQNDGGGGGEANGGLMAMARGGMSQQFNLGDYSDGGRLLRGPGDGISDSIPASIGGKRPARLADGEFVVPARIVSELGNGSTEAGARKLYAMMDRVQKARRGTVGKGKVAKNSRSDKYLPA